MTEKQIKEEIDNLVFINEYIVNNAEKLPPELISKYIVKVLEFNDCIKPLYAVAVTLIEGGDK